ncbi:hypothetical protein GCK72_025218 [Caenorhabditis remanei]|uniref:UBC core domain-containing protein n=1 Tax=Caenorhabditis remanei TaxID=31234 RepID=A0A6A5G1W1_CAERE|nr:hypothetical protein GCK72_025218 [Caenorhabditis remanei]KAF1748751.1 hypothetical protein GCK72_025218 [Caenorhabditis remanei]
MASLAMTRVMRECREVANATDITEAGIHVILTDNNIRNIQGFIKGPADSPYADGIFEVMMAIPDQYPFAPPKVRFVSRIWHPNISSQTGVICLDILKDKWAASLTIRTVLLSIQAMMCSPEASDPQDAVVARQYITNFDMFKATAKYWAAYFAQSKKDVDQIYREKVFLLKEMGINETDAVVMLSCSDWKLDEAVQCIFSQ